MSSTYDVAIIGAGVLGLAHAYQFAKRGQRVLVLERHAKAQGASVRNFGMIWPMGQPLGSRYDLACRSRAIWQDVLDQAGLWYSPCGSLHVVYHADEEQVLREFADESRGQRPCEWLTPTQVIEQFPSIQPVGLRAGLFSPTEMTVDPRQIIGELPRWLANTFKVAFEWSNPVQYLAGETLHTVNGERRAKRIVICTGTDFRDLAPSSFADSGLFPCKLQMMRTQPYGATFNVGTMLAAGLTLKHYTSFANCPSLPKLAERLQAEAAEYLALGIHVMVAQNGLGELILGDSHEYGSAIDIVDRTEIDELILRYLHTFFRAPAMRIAGRWHGLYIKHPTQPYVVAQPAPNTMAVTGVGGAGMTLSFGLAEYLVQQWLGESA